MIRPHSLDSETIERLREVVAATYAGRDDLYAAARDVGDEELSAICRKLAEDLADNSAHLEQIIVMHGKEPRGKEEIAAALREVIKKFLSERGSLSAAKKAQSGVRDQYDAAIAATSDREAQAILRRQREDVDFGEKVLGRIAKTGEDQPNPPCP